jgi:hypothetical protein
VLLLKDFAVHVRALPLQNDAYDVCKTQSHRIVVSNNDLMQIMELLYLFFNKKSIKKYKKIDTDGQIFLNNWVFGN